MSSISGYEETIMKNVICGLIFLGTISGCATQPVKETVGYCHVTPELLKQGFYSLKKRAAKGVDGIGWSEYEVNEEANLADLYQRMQNRSIDAHGASMGI